MRCDTLEQIEEIKEKFGQQAESIIASGLGLRKSNKKYHCPNIYKHKHGDKDPSMSWYEEGQMFRCFTCGMKIDIYSYYREHLNYSHSEVVRELLGETDYKQTTMQKSRETFESETKKVDPLNSQCLEYINLRGISEDTAKKFKLGTYKGDIAFPYFRYETVVGYKTRKPSKDPGKPKMKSITGSKPYLYNAQNIEQGGELIICEGEFDCMVIDQVGYTNVVSVGAGANSLATLIEQATDFLNQFEILIVVSDNDESGDNMDQLLSKTFKNKVKLIDKKLYARKDINEELVVNGKDKVIEIIESARWKIEGRRDLEKKPYQGLKSIKGNFIPTGLETIDNAINDLAPRCVTLIAGRTSEGKTTFVKQVIVNAIDKGNKVYLMSGEGDPESLLNGLYQVVVGRDHQFYDIVKINKKYRKEPKPEILKKLQVWHNRKLVLFNKGDSKLKTIHELTNMLEEEIKFNKYDLVVIDNLMSILSVQAAEKYEQQADFMQRLCDISKAYGVHIILVLHPNKTYRKGEEMDVEQISGSSDIYNKADNIITITREYDEDKTSQGINGSVAVKKNRYYGELVKTNVYYDKDTETLLERQDDGTVYAYHFDWQGKKEIPDGFQLVLSKDCPF